MEFEEIMGKVKRWQIRNIKTAYKALYFKCRKSDISIEEQNKILNEFFDETYYKISEKILDGEDDEYKKKELRKFYNNIKKTIREVGKGI